MNNTKIHQGLEKSELRDFFSISLLRNLEKSINNKREKVFKDNEFVKNGLDFQITYAKNEIKYQKKEIELLNEKKSLLLLMENMGWSDFDVSDETKRDFDSEYWLNFVGTKKEYENFLHSLR